MLKCKEVQKTTLNKKIFRKLARDNGGESLEPNEDEKMLFGYGESRMGEGESFQLKFFCLSAFMNCVYPIFL